jgi:hypothetical protein
MKIQHLVNESQNVAGVGSETISYGDLSDIQKSVLAKLYSGAISYDTVSANTKRTIDELESLGLVYLGDVTDSGEKMVDIYNELNGLAPEIAALSSATSASNKKLKNEPQSFNDDGGDDELRF